MVAGRRHDVKCQRKMVRRSEGPIPKMVTTLKDLIQADGRTLGELARASGLAGGQLSRFMRGERDIQFDAAARLIDVLGAKITPPESAAPAKAKPAKPKKRKK
jgi:transcriptional regulator with XRE-family HTH domain